MLKMNYHTHSRYCDGEGSPRDYIESALSRDFKALGFSGHSPLPFPNDWTMDDENLPLYLNEIRQLKDEYRDTLEIYLGLETDYLDSTHNPAREIYRSLGLDYQIGSVHLLPDSRDGLFYSIDGPLNELDHLINNTYGGSVVDLVTAYYHQVKKMVNLGGFDILGHFDLIKKHNRELEFFSEEDGWYREIVNDLLPVIAESGIMIEVNTGGMSRNYTNGPYPSKWILKRCAELNIPVVVNSDAHRPDLIEYAFGEIEELLSSVGITGGWALLDGIWKEVSFG